MPSRVALLHLLLFQWVDIASLECCRAKTVGIGHTPHINHPNQTKGRLTEKPKQGKYDRQTVEPLQICALLGGLDYTLVEETTFPI